MKKYVFMMLILSNVFTYTLAHANEAYSHQQNEKQAIETVLNSFHQAAATANGKKYFDLLTEDSVFLGTDASERWTKKQFKAFALPYFSKGKGWLYTPIQRHINLHENGKVAFFDELLTNATYGQCRGTGVLWLTDQGWKIAQYNLSIPMPNAIAGDLVKQIQSYEKNNK